MTPTTTYEPNKSRRRPRVCPGCCPALILQRRAVPARRCPECLAERVREMDARGQR